MILMIRDQAVEQVLRLLTLSKSRSEASATLTASLLTDAADNYLPGLSVAVGDPIRLLEDDGAAVFSGAVQEVRRTGETVTLVAYDRGIYLTRNELYGVFAGTGAQIAAQVAGKLGIALGVVDAQPIYRTIVSTSADTAFSILRRAVGEDREVWMEGAILRVGRERGETVAVNSGAVLTVESRASIREMVDRAVVLRRGGALAASRENAAHIAAYGQFQAVETLSGTDAASQAGEMLRGKTLTASLTVLGDLALRCGGRVVLSAPEWGLEGTYRVTECLHHWERGLYTTELEIEAV